MPVISVNGILKPVKELFPGRVYVVNAFQNLALRTASNK